MGKFERDGFRSTFMFQEIMEEPETIINTVNSISSDISKAVNLIKNGKITYVVGSGTSYHAAVIMQIGMLKAGFPAIAVRSSEFSCFTPPGNVGIVVLLISQSGESKDIKDALNLCRKNGYHTIGITNSAKSTIATETEVSIVTAAGEERSLAATKSHIAQLIVSYLLISSLKEHGKIEDYKEKSVDIASRIREIIDMNKDYSKLARNITGRIVFLGDGTLHAEAMEGALKFEETANMITEAYPLGEYLHGPIQVLRSDDTVIILKGRDNKEYERLISRLNNFTKNIITIGKSKESTIPIPECEIEDLDPILYIIPVQILANIKTVDLGLDPDKPTRLTKVVK